MTRSTRANDPLDTAASGTSGDQPGKPTQSGYREVPRPTQIDRDKPNPIKAGGEASQTRTDDGAGEDGGSGDKPRIDQPLPPGDIPNKEPVKEPEHARPEYVDTPGTQREPPSARPQRPRQM